MSHFDDSLVEIYRSELDLWAEGLELVGVPIPDEISTKHQRALEALEQSLAQPDSSVAMTHLSVLGEARDAIFRFSDEDTQAQIDLREEATLAAIRASWALNKASAHHGRRVRRCMLTLKAAMAIDDARQIRRAIESLEASLFEDDPPPGSRAALA